jgi:transcriptional regulator
MAVHAYGRASILSGERLRNILSEMMARYESGSEKPVRWESLPDDFLDKQIEGIVGFEIEVDRFEAAYKLSQNRNTEDYSNIVSQLEKSGGTDERRVAEQMRRIRP